MEQEVPLLDFERFCHLVAYIVNKFFFLLFYKEGHSIIHLLMKQEVISISRLNRFTPAKAKKHDTLDLVGSIICWGGGTEKYDYLGCPEIYELFPMFPVKTDCVSRVISTPPM